MLFDGKYDDFKADGGSVANETFQRISKHQSRHFSDREWQEESRKFDGGERKRHDRDGGRKFDRDGGRKFDRDGGRKFDRDGRRTLDRECGIKYLTVAAGQG
ncbi:MAG: hypothetical protein K2F64_01970, partial [Muribaculaceae bacterium]|nr:hypothetical protein [Muribaculaceae bacterium]